MESTLLLCARVRQGHEQEFRTWQARWQHEMLQSPGARSFEVLPETPDQDEVVGVAHFETLKALRAWRHGRTNGALIDEVREHVDGGMVMQLAGKAAAEYYVQQSATEVIITRVKAGKEEAYRAFADRIQHAQQNFPGYIGSFVQPPQHHETGWTTVLRFQTVRDLDHWLNSPERKALLKESEDLVEGFQAQRVDTSFPGWVPADPSTGKPPNMWKTAGLVLLVLFPVIMLELRFLNPVLRAAHFPPALGTFTGNAISVALTTWPLMPLAIRAFHYWLFPEGQPKWLVLTSPGILFACYLVELAIFWRLL
ncbi:MAG TPA: antibiotic biosynthesis monooxygenase [Candidatus Dormibacteraeota bacterium]|nr:antibiotic biosynthesis monooxygenase [Candidatus Dormibacteraeota bacterium]